MTEFHSVLKAGSRFPPLLGNVGQLDLGPMGPDGLRLLLVQLQLATVAFSARAQVSRRNSAICRASSPRGLEQSMGVGVFRGDGQGIAFSLTLVTGLLYARALQF